VLGVAQIGLHDNFFELGGHSLLATQVTARIRARFRVELLIRAVFEHPRLAELARAVEQAAFGAALLPPIEPQPADEPKVLSFAQQRLWFLAQWEGGDDATYNMPLALALDGALDMEALRASLAWLAERHESLRTCFPAVDGQAGVALRPADAGAALAVHDLAALAAEAQAQEVRRRADAHALAPFDLACGPLFKADLLVLGEGRHALLLNLHHIISDGWSWGVLLRDWQQAYAAFARGQEPALPAPRLQYSDYAAWQRRWLQGDVLQAQADYWAAQLDGCPALLELPTDRPRPPQQSHRGTHHAQVLPPALGAELHRLGRAYGATLFMTLLAAFGVLLARHSRQDDLCVGTPVANRTHHQAEDLVGFFVNTLVLRVRLAPGQTFAELLAEVRETCLAAYARQDLPFEALVERLRPERSPGHSPLFQVMFVLQNNDSPALALPGLDVRPLAQDFPVAKFDLTLHMEEREGQLHGHWEYAADLFDAATIERMAGHFKTLLEAAVADPGQPVHALPILTEAERQQLIAWNRTEADYPQDQTIIDLFERQVEKTPGHTAVVFEDQSLTYAELNARANRLAHRLLSLKAEDGALLVRPDALVAVCVERSLEMVIGLLGVLKAGAAYVPIDPGYPEERVAFMLADSAASALLTQTALLARLPVEGLGHPCRALCLDQADFADYPAHNPPPHSRPENLAYVIYTSGSTGRPKGVMLEHRGAVNLAAFQRQYFRTGADSRVLQFASLSFDAASWEVLMALCGGAALYLVPFNQIQVDISAVLQIQAITHATLPPSALGVLSEIDLPDLAYLTVAGEACPPDLVACWAAGRHFINAYGPTEATVCASVFECQPDGQKPPIGKPIANTRIYVLDGHGQPLPPGVPGELCVAGAGLARGYLNRPALTAEKFVEIEVFGQRERVYKTGDLARWLPDGNLEFLGRIDHQVKLRGFRIELGEIEAALAGHEAVREAVVVLHPGDGNPRLVAYIVASDLWPVVSGQETSADAQGASSSLVTDHKSLTTFLKARLPDYMVPAHLQILDALPLTPNGKVDRQALPAPDAGVGQARPGLPRDAVELRLLPIWETVLQAPSLGVHDDFFALGGHSLLAVKLMSHIQQAFGRRLPVSLLFTRPTVAGLAEALRGAESAVPPTALVPLQPQGQGLPVHCLPGAIGSVLYLYPLASHLGTGQPVYALPTPGLDGAPTPPTVQALAAYHLEALRQRQPHGPYQLAGHSFGGRVAFEMAWQLEQQGETVALLAILDTTAPDPEVIDDTADHTDLDWLHNIAKVFEMLASQDFGVTLDALRAQPGPEAAYALVLRAFQQREVLFAPSASADELKSLVEVYRATIKAHLDYRLPGQVRCPIRLFRADEPMTEAAVEDSREAWGWAACTQAGVEVIAAPGNHFTMMAEPHVRTLAERLASQLSASRPARS
jgi:amino acid adenylation domain-containing protein